MNTDAAEVPDRIELVLVDDLPADGSRRTRAERVRSIVKSALRKHGWRCTRITPPVVLPVENAEGAD